jgi:hypothetical protein
VLLGVTLVVRRQRADPAAARARRAAAASLAVLRGATSASDPSTQVLDAVRDYLGARLRRPGGALTYPDVAAPLAQHGVDETTLADLEQLFRDCEAGRYGGSSTDTDALVANATTLVRRLERTLR